VLANALNTGRGCCRESCCCFNAAAAAARLKRAGLDYWPHVCMKVHDSWEVRPAAAATAAAQTACPRHWCFSRGGRTSVHVRTRLYIHVAAARNPQCIMLLSASAVLCCVTHCFSFLPDLHCMWVDTCTCICCLPCQDFFAFFQGLPGPKRLIGYSVYGDTYYAGPGGAG
jgi:hypothetical protein